ncbi:hypothetical protein C0Q70_08374 [Pomacea canaliculata]|uniref:Protein-tyrosine sulfotransferase n=1 Tax=Pomacea canaliculata TaxID=400727 RepID=A0A2T7PHP5_POMCA|nr:hypothetical protein C0Q70_08374 [Pomacea canaliculata]
MAGKNVGLKTALEFVVVSFLFLLKVSQKQAQSVAGLRHCSVVTSGCVHTLAKQPLEPTDDTAMGVCRPSTRRKYFLLLLLLSAVYLLYLLFPCPQRSSYVMVPRDKVHFMYDGDNRAIPYDENMEVIFIGGMPRSGTTLMRVMLDAHPLVRCGEETRVIPRILGLRTQWERTPMEKKRLEAAGLSSEVLDSAVRAFIMEIIAKHGEAAPRLCNKDPFTLKSAIYLSQQFPQAKFILMVRDGRAVVHSIITRKVTISGFDLGNYRLCLQKWNQAMEYMYTQCLRVGPARCMPVYYEQLALHPRDWMGKILHFLSLPWNESVMHHQDFIGEKGGISLSRCVGLVLSSVCEGIDLEPHRPSHFDFDHMPTLPQPKPNQPKEDQIYSAPKDESTNAEDESIIDNLS